MTPVRRDGLAVGILTGSIAIVALFLMWGFLK